MKGTTMSKTTSTTSTTNTNTTKLRRRTLIEWLTRKPIPVQATFTTATGTRIDAYRNARLYDLAN